MWAGRWVVRTSASSETHLTGRFYVFAGEGPTDAPLNDMWAYDLAAHRWSEVGQRYSAPGGATIDPREIYNISYDYHGGFYLFGGSYLFAAKGAAAPPLYANDLWHFDGASQTWTLLGGKANGYDPEMPLPRHYYGQSSDQDGNFYLLDGYVSDTTVPPYFGGGGRLRTSGAVGFDGKDGSADRRIRDSGLLAVHGATGQLAGSDEHARRSDGQAGDSLCDGHGPLRGAIRHVWRLAPGTRHVAAIIGQLVLPAVGAARPDAGRAVARASDGGTAIGDMGHAICHRGTGTHSSRDPVRGESDARPVGPDWVRSLIFIQYGGPCLPDRRRLSGTLFLL